MGIEAGSQDKRKRTLEALERRFVAAKAELLQQQKKSQKHKSDAEDRQETFTSTSRNENNKNMGTSSIASAANPPVTPVTPFLNSSSKRGMEESGPEYLHLSRNVHENLLSTSVKFESKKASMVDMLLHDLLQHGDSAKKYMQGGRSKKLENWILLDNYVKGRGRSSSSYIRTLVAHSKRSKRHMSMKGHKKCGSFNLPLDLQKFDSFKPMHEMWKAYIVQLIKNTGTNQLAQCFLGADLHGAITLVVECKIASYTGVTGIMIRETAETLGIITQDDEFRVVPKRYSVFIFQVDCWKITLQGDRLTSRNLGL